MVLRASAWAGLGVAFGRAVCAEAATARVENRCPGLAEAAYEEIDARVQLLLRGARQQRDPPAVVCGEQGSWLEWEGRRFPIVGRASIQDEVVDIVDAELNEPEPSDAAERSTVDDTVVPGDRPALERAAGASPAPPAKVPRSHPPAQRPSEARGGGVAVGMETELPSSTIGVALGPTFDFATSAGPLLIGGREAFRLVPAGRRKVMFMDFQGLLAVGAPLNADARFGAVVRFGAEWMVAYPEGNSSQAVVTPVLDAGLRVAHQLRSVGLWFGLDAHWRLSQLALHSESSLIANDVGGSFTAGVAFLDWSRK